MRKLLCCLIILFLPILTSCGTSVGTGVFFGWPGYGWGGPGAGVGTDVFFYPQVDRSTATPQDIQMLNSVKNLAIKSGYSVVDANTPDTVGFKAIRHIYNITETDINGLPDFITKDSPRFITVTNGKDKDYYKIRAIVDLTGKNNPEIRTPASYSPSEIKVRMALPGKVTYTNAQQKYNNGKNLEWSLVTGKKNLIEANFEIGRE